MPRGVHGSGTARSKPLTPSQARELRDRLHAQLQEIEEQDARRYALMGKAVAEQAESDATFAEQLKRILEARISDRGERVCLGLPIEKRPGRGRPRKARAGTVELSGDEPDRGAEMA